MGEAYVPTEQQEESEEARVPPSHVDESRPVDLEGPPPEGASTSVGLIWRVNRRRTFAAMRDAPSGRYGGLTVSWLGGRDEEPLRVAFAIGKKVGGAVERNRARRRLRSLMRELSGSLPRGSYLIGMQPSAARLGYQELNTALVHALHAATRRASPDALARRELVS